MTALLQSRWTRLAAFVVVLVALAVLPLYVQPITNQTITRIGVFAVAVLGLNIVMGYAGQVSLGHVFFVGVGAYATSILITAEWSQDLGQGRVLLGFVLAVVVPGAMGWLVALAAARLRGLGLALVTIALPIVGVPLAKRFSALTGGSEGKSSLFIPKQSGALFTDQIQYYIVVGIALALFVLAFFLVRGKYGRAFAVVKANEAVAASLGISPYRYKVLAFTIAAMIGGAAGFLYIVAFQYTSPDTLAFSHSIALVIAAVVGGSGSIVGSVLGGAFYVLIPQWANKIDPNSFDVVQGAVVLIVLFLLPGGLATLPHALRRLVRRRRPQDDNRSTTQKGTHP